MEALGHITRKSMLYRTKVEYGDWAMNHVQGCAHGCKYPCYAFLMAKRFSRVKDYEEWMRPSIVDNTMELLQNELPKHKSEIRQVQLCFTTDPFMIGYHEVGRMSIKAIRLINSYDIPCVILTKGILPSELADLSKANIYGITLVSLDEKFRKQMEPHAAPLAERLAALKALHDNGCKTWVSMEPYPTPNVWKQQLQPILDAVCFADRIVFGRTHYDKRTSGYKELDSFYHDAAARVRSFCTENGIDCHIKKGTAG
ncbi:MAG: DNA repair photolyase [Atopobium sp.]|jgi:DNA repair photolyase